MIKFKINVLQELKKKGYTTTKIREDRVLSEATLQRIRKNDGDAITTKTLNILCEILKRQPGAIIEYIPDDKT